MVLGTIFICFHNLYISFIFSIRKLLNLATIQEEVEPKFDLYIRNL